MRGTHQPVLCQFFAALQAAERPPWWGTGGWTTIVLCAACGAPITGTRYYVATSWPEAPRGPCCAPCAGVAANP